MKKISTFVLILIGLFIFKPGQAQTVYASLGSGAWNSGTQWETYSTLAAALAGSPGSGTASTSTTNPGGTHFVLIRAGHTVTMGAANRGCKGIVIQAGGKLYANEAAARRLQIGAGGTGFTYPLVDTIQVDGALGAANDGLYLESGAAAQTIKLFGSGTVDIQRIRTVGGATGGVLNFNIDVNVNLWQASNYALTSAYNATASDVYTINILAGRTVAIKSTSGVFHNSQTSGTANGIHNYVINGILDLSANTQTGSNISGNILAPGPSTSSKVSIVVDGGLMKLGAAFKTDTSALLPSNGTIEFKAINGGIIDGSLTTVTNFRTADGAGGIKDLFIGLDATSQLKLPVAATEVRFPVSLATSTTPNTAAITNAGLSDVFSVALKATFDNAPADASKVVNRQWNITEAAAGGSNATLKLSWTTADQAAGFSPAGTVSIMHWTGTAWEYFPAVVSGSGVITDPYVATASGITSFSPFGVTSFIPIPLTLLSFNASYNNQLVNLVWQTTNEINSKNFEIERSNDGRNFSSIGTVVANNSQATNNYSFADAQPLVGASYYRLKIVDKDGKFKNSSVIVINTKLKGGLMVYPNPSTENVTVSHSKASANTTLQVLTVSGIKISSTVIAKDAVQTSVDVSKLTAGNYVIVINNGTERSTVKFVKN